MIIVAAHTYRAHDNINNYVLGMRPAIIISVDTLSPTHCLKSIFLLQQTMTIMPLTWCGRLVILMYGHFCYSWIQGSWGYWTGVVTWRWSKHGCRVWQGVTVLLRLLMMVSVHIVELSVLKVNTWFINRYGCSTSSHAQPTLSMISAGVEGTHPDLSNNYVSHECTYSCVFITPWLTITLD